MRTFLGALPTVHCFTYLCLCFKTASDCVKVVTQCLNKHIFKLRTRHQCSGIKCQQSYLNNLAHCALLPTNELTHLTKSCLLHVENRAHCLHGVPENLPSNLCERLWNCCSINCQVTIKVQSNTEVKKANTNWENNNNNQCIILEFSVITVSVKTSKYYKIGYFRVAPSLCIKGKLNAKLLI